MISLFIIHNFSLLLFWCILRLQFRTQFAAATTGAATHAVLDVWRLEGTLDFNAVTDNLRGFELVLHLGLTVDGGFTIDLCLVTTHSGIATVELNSSLAVALLHLQCLVGKGTDLL